MIPIIGTVLSALLSGGATGIIGVIIQRFFDMKGKQNDLEVLKLQHANGIALEEMRLRHLTMTIEGNVRVAQTEADGKEAVAAQERLSTEAQVDAEIRAAAYEADQSKYFGLSRASSGKFGTWVDALVSLLFGFVDTVRGLTRPVLTAVLVFMVYNLYRLLEKIGISGLTPEAVTQLWLQIVGATIYLATVAVIFWFGNRPPAKQEK